MSSGCLGLTLQEEEAKADRAASAAATEDELEALEDALADAEAADLGNPYLDGMEEDEEGDFEGRREETFVWLLSAPTCRSSVAFLYQLILVAPRGRSSALSKKEGDGD